MTGTVVVTTPPTVTAIAPASGPSGGGTGITITGTNFQAGAGVKIGGISATGVTVLNATQITATTPALSAGTLNDVLVTNPDMGSGTLSKGWFANFLDVPASHPFHGFVQKIFRFGITAGCGAGNYCPEQPVLREQMAAFIIRGLGEFNPPIPPMQRFLDVPPSNPFYNFIDRMAVRQITLGCGGDNYCPQDPVVREQMAVFILRALGEFNPPIPPMQRFLDVPPSNPFYNFIDRMAVLGITQGCSADPPLYCPTLSVTRGQMAVFLTRAFLP